MGGSAVLIHIGIATFAVVAAVVALKLEPVISLVLGAGYLGLVTGQGAVGTIKTITGGFADVMGKIGLLIAFGVLLGALVNALGVPQRIADQLLKVMGRRGLPYAYGLTLSGLLASVYADVLLVLCGPLTKHAAARMGRNGHGLLSGTAIAGIAIGVNFIVPGVGLMAVVGVLGVPLRFAFLYALPLGLVTVVLTVFIYTRLIRWNLWNEAKDQEFVLKEVLADDDTPAAAPSSTGSARHGEDDELATRTGGAGTLVKVATRRRNAPLLVLVSPLLVTVGFLLVSALAETAGLKGTWIDVLGNPSAAVFAGLLIAYFLARSLLTAEQLGDAIRQALQTSGSILMLTGVSGALAAVVKGTGVGDVLGGLFTGGGAAPLLLTWVIAAALHMAVGSITLGAVTAAGILTPVALAAGPQGAVMIGLAALSGGLFAGLPNANGFWLFKSVFDLSIRGAFKTYTLAPSIASVVSLLLLIALDLVI